MKLSNRYPGLAKSFYKGYKELSDDDFFGIDDQDLKKMNLVTVSICTSRLVSSLIFLSILMKRMFLFMRVANQTDTFEDVCELARDIYKYCKSHTPSTDQHNNQKQRHLTVNLVTL